METLPLLAYILERGRAQPLVDSLDMLARLLLVATVLGWNGHHADAIAVWLSAKRSLIEDEAVAAKLGWQLAQL